MNFQSIKNETYWWPVIVRRPSAQKEDAGKLVAQKLLMQFKVVERDAEMAAQEAYKALENAQEIVEFEIDQMIDKCLNWDGVDGDDGAPKPFSKDNLRGELQKSWFRSAVYQALAESMSGEEARTGN